MRSNHHLPASTKVLSDLGRAGGLCCGLGVWSLVPLEPNVVFLKYPPRILVKATRDIAAGKRCVVCDASLVEPHALC